MFGELVIAYLFLAGVGAGGTGFAALADLLCLRDSFGLESPDGLSKRSSASRAVAFVLAALCGALVLGAACLLADLGRTDRVLSLFVAWPPTVMTVGAWAVALLIAVTAVLALVRFLYVPVVRRRAVAVLEVAAIVLAAVVAVYAGLLLQSLAGVRLWSTPLVPVLFVLSAISCGCALPLIASLFVEDDGTLAPLVRWAARIDAAVIVAEAIAAALFLGFVLGSAHPGVQASAISLMHGLAALPWWIGFVICGLLLPFAVEVICAARWRRGSTVGGSLLAPLPAVLALTGALVLVGAVGLRAAVVEAGAQRALELQEPAPTVQETEREDVFAWLS